MTTVWWAWGLSAAAMVTLAAWVGIVIKTRWYGILIDGRGRVSLSRFQLVWWTIIVLSLVCGVVVGRFTFDPGTGAGIEVLGFSIPESVLGLLGISVGTTVASSAVKTYKGRRRSRQAAAAAPGSAEVAQILLVEEGAVADQTIDVGKFQALIVTILLGGAYVLTTIHAFMGRDPVPIENPSDISTLPDLNTTFLALLAISMAGYLGVKTVPRTGEPPTSVEDLDDEEERRRARDKDEGLAMDGRSVAKRRVADADLAEQEAKVREATRSAERRLKAAEKEAEGARARAEAARAERDQSVADAATAKREAAEAKARDEAARAERDQSYAAGPGGSPGEQR
ncbi:hypothetical protein Cch01nite_15180 [Cellulomonas chitinilytica]|uniref:Uncharacterized protein n=1 Tax=Cellulomonas chitinilytica TaxID=398759 RepID=A0A919P3L3_9CELL|nr:hypothetical protein [Cellulomonas chitinilytica]GIG20794.1 hypothetical protein Cch01nite_15180 [Cellulomonas chitinilytica]